MRVLLLLPAALAAIAQVTTPPGWRVLYQDNFEDGSAERWSVSQGQGSQGTWEVQSEGSNHVFAGESFSWVRLNSHGPWLDFRFKARVKVVAGSILFHYRMRASRYYMLGLHPSSLVLVRTTGSEDTNLINVAGNYPLGRWYQVEIVGIGRNIKVYVDGTLKIDYTDTVEPAPGTVGFEAPPGSSLVQVDDVEISGPALPELAWVKTGGPVGGIGYDVRMRPDNPDVMYATDSWSGLHASNDGGRTWFPSNAGIAAAGGPSGDAVPVFCVTIDPHDSNVVWVGLQNNRGIYRSADGGKSWTLKVRGITESNGISFRGITIDPRDPNTVYAAAEISSFAWAGSSLRGKEFDLTKGVVYRTRDGGENWTAIWRGDNLARYIWIDPRDSNVIYVSTGIFDREAANSDLLHGVPGGVGILKSVDGGRTWQTLDGANGLTNLYIGSLFMHPNDPECLLGGSGLVNLGRSGTGVFLTVDGGKTWKRGTVKGSGEVIEEMINSVEFAVSDPRIAYAAGPGTFYRSEDSGRNWRAMSGGPPQNFYGPAGVKTGFPIDLQVDPRNPDRVFINSYGGGNFISEDGGASWVNASKGYTGAQIVALALGRTDFKRIYAVNRFDNIFRTLDAGETWEGLYNNSAMVSPWSAITSKPDNPEIVLVANEEQGELFRTQDGGRTWVRAFKHPQVPPPPAQDGGHGFKALAFSTSNPDVVYAGLCLQQREIDRGNSAPGLGIYRSPDGGATWREVNDSNIGRQHINVLAVDPRSEDIAYAGTVRGGVFRTMDGGRTWQSLNQGLRLPDIRALAIAPDDPFTIYAGLENGGVYKTADAGASWQMAGYGMDPQASVRSIVIDPTNTQILYAADFRMGVYRSDDGGKLWVAINQGLSTRAVNALAFSSDGGTLYAATEGAGVFRLDIKPFER